MPEPALPAAPARPGRSIRVLTWNVHAGIGPDGRYDLPRIVALVRRHQPDIIALQELDSRGRGITSPFDYLSVALGTHAAEAKTISAPDGDYGHVLISRWPLTDIAIHDLSISRREPRRAIEATVRTPTVRCISLRCILASASANGVNRRRCWRPSPARRGIPR